MSNSFIFNGNKQPLVLFPCNIVLKLLTLNVATKIYTCEIILKLFKIFRLIFSQIENGGGIAVSPTILSRTLTQAQRLAILRQKNWHTSAALVFSTKW